jgi:ABC-three component (ABC-3C) system Middle Component 4
MYENILGLYIDDDFFFNVAITIILMEKLAVNRNGKFKLDFDKLQIFLYLIRNPSKINLLLEGLGKKPQFIDTKQIYTIESLSNNVDILYDRSRLKCILQKIAALEMLQTEIDEKGIVYFALSQRGVEAAQDLKKEHFTNVSETIQNLQGIQSVTTPKLFSMLNTVI